MSDRNPDDSLFVEFHAMAVEDPEATKRNGYKTWKDVDYVRIRTDNFNELDIPVRHDENPDAYSDIRRFAKQWERYKAKAANQIVGIPLEKCPFMTPARIKMYAQEDVNTVEQLADMADSRIQRFGMGALDDKKQANKYLEVAKKNEQYDSLQKQLDELTAKNEALELEVNSRKKGKPEVRQAA